MTEMERSEIEAHLLHAQQLLLQNDFTIEKLKNTGNGFLGFFMAVMHFSVWLLIFAKRAYSNETCFSREALSGYESFEGDRCNEAWRRLHGGR